MKLGRLFLLFSSFALAQQFPPPSGGGGSGTVTSVSCGTGLSGGTFTTSGTCAVIVTAIGQKFFGTAPPTSPAGNLPGDTFSDTTNHNVYQCNAPSGTAAPACTSVTTGGWTLLNPAIGGTPAAFASIPGTCTPNGSNAFFQQTDGPYHAICTSTNTYTLFMDEFGKTAPPQIGAFTAINMTNATDVNTYGPLDMATTSSSAGAWNMHCLMKAVPTAPYTFTALIGVGQAGVSNIRAGLALGTAGATPSLVTFEILQNSGVLTFNSDFLTNPTTISGANWATTSPTILWSPIWVQLSDDSTNRHYKTSIDGQNFFDVHAESNTHDITPTQIGFCMQNDTANIPVLMRIYDQH